MKLKRVLHLVNSKPVVQMVLNDYIQCSVTKEYRPPSEFCRDGETYKSRTNCAKAYYMPWDEMDDLKRHNEKIIKTNDEYRKLQAMLKIEPRMKESSLSVCELIEVLSKLNPEDRIVVEQEAEEPTDTYVDLEMPKFHRTFDGTDYYTLFEI